jgi:hypothetical protein
MIVSFPPQKSGTQTNNCASSFIDDSAEAVSGFEVICCLLRLPSRLGPSSQAVAVPSPEHLRHELPSSTAKAVLSSLPRLKMWKVTQSTQRALGGVL